MDMVTDRVLSQVQMVRNLFVGEPASYEPHQLLFAIGQSQRSPDLKTWQLVLSCGKSEQESANLTGTCGTAACNRPHRPDHLQSGGVLDDVAHRALANGLEKLLAIRLHADHHQL